VHFWPCHYRSYWHECIEPNWQAELTERNHLILKRSADTFQAKIQNLKSKIDPISDVRNFQQSVSGIAEQMGITLQNTSSSVNIKERLDFSCAIFDSKVSWLLMRHIFQSIWGR